VKRGQDENHSGIRKLGSGYDSGGPENYWTEKWTNETVVTSNKQNMKPEDVFLISTNSK